MNFRSTRDRSPPVSLSQALRTGLAPDGGLYVPAVLPACGWERLSRQAAIDSVAVPLLAPYFEGDALESRLSEIARDALNFPVPLTPIGDAGRSASLLELFHGPTAAFKDLGARFLAACLQQIPHADSRPLTVLVATSGDTGGAVAAAFHLRPGFRVILLYPAGRVSPLQERQLCGWDGNVRSFAVRGSFDDCQSLAKRAFTDETLRERLRLTSANSINVGRLLPQLVSFAAAAIAQQSATGREAGFVIPSGNLGHAVACLWARAMGLPIGEVILAHNANRAMVDFLAGVEWRRGAAIATIASAMDVADPSNRERLLDLLPDPAAAAARLTAVSIDDDAIRARIRAESRQSGLVLCPHSAVAMEAWRRLPAAKRDQPWIVVATAHAAKFPEIVEPLIGQPVALPASLAGLADRPFRREEIDADFEGLCERMLAA